MKSYQFGFQSTPPHGGRHRTNEILSAIIEKTGAKKHQDTPWYLGHCPFHDDEHPSMYFADDRFQCMACGEKGDLARLAGKLEVVGTAD